MMVFLLYHAYESDLGDEEVKLIGVYSSEPHAKAAAAKTARLPGFSNFPDNFQISPMELDKDYWTEGFETVKWREE